MKSDTHLLTKLQQLDYSVNIDRRIIYIDGEIDTFTPPFFLDRVNLIREMNENKLNKKNFDINLYITSPGGAVSSLLALIDLIQSLPIKVNTYGFGHVESAAVWLLASGTGKRYISPNTEVMIHQISTWLEGTSSDVENEAKQLINIQKNLYKLLEEFTNKPNVFWEKILKTRKNVYFTPEQCIEYGLADSLVKKGSI